MTATAANGVYAPLNLLKQQALIRWFAFQTRANASRMKAEGMVKGVVDLILLYPSNGMHGAVIEMKRPGEKATTEQLAWMANRKEAGYATALCYSFEEAKGFIEGYLSAKS